MFEPQKFQGDSTQSIKIQTRAGNNVQNEIGVQITDKQINDYERLLKKCGQFWKIRKPPCAEYNCAGHIWASRRACLYDEDDWLLILKDDGYRRTKHPHPDDIVIYRDADIGIVHIGRIMELRESDSLNLTIPFVVSKWDATSGEVLHNLHDTPWHIQNIKALPEFWTDRPGEERS